jgi:hypothetical protein
MPSRHPAKAISRAGNKNLLTSNQMTLVSKGTAICCAISCKDYDDGLDSRVKQKPAS